MLCLPRNGSEVSDSQYEGSTYATIESSDLVRHISDLLCLILDDAEEVGVHDEYRGCLVCQTGLEAVQT